MTQLANKTILITGAAGGFGQEFARQLLARGNQLILTDWQAEPLAQLATNATRPGQVLAHFATDLLALDGPETLARQTQELDTPVDILINNAGTAVFGRVDEVPAKQWQRVVQLNLMVPMALSAAFAFWWGRRKPLAPIAAEPVVGEADEVATPEAEPTTTED